MTYPEVRSVTKRENGHSLRPTETQPIASCSIHIGTAGPDAFDQRCFMQNTQQQQKPQQ